MFGEEFCFQVSKDFDLGSLWRTWCSFLKRTGANLLLNLFLTVSLLTLGSYLALRELPKLVPYQRDTSTDSHKATKMKLQKKPNPKYLFTYWRYVFAFAISSPTKIKLFSFAIDWRFLWSFIFKMKFLLVVFFFFSFSLWVEEVCSKEKSSKKGKGKKKQYLCPSYVPYFFYTFVWWWSCHIFIFWNHVAIEVEGDTFCWKNGARGGDKRRRVWPAS